MLNRQSFKLVFWFGLLTLPGMLVDKADAAILNRRVTIQPIQVCNNFGLACATMKFFEPETDKIWAQAGIDIRFLPSVKLNKTSFLTIDNSTELTSLFGGTGNKQHPDSNVINMWFLDKLILGGGTTFGVTQSLGARNIAIAKDTFTFNRGIGRRDTIAHEIGHSLGLGHNTFGAGGRLNLMTDGSSRAIPSSVNDIFPSGAKTDQLTSGQINKAKSSKYARCINSIFGICLPFGVLDSASVADEESAIDTSFPNEVAIEESPETIDPSQFLIEALSIEEIAEVSVPEPSTNLALLGVGIFSLYWQFKSKRDSFKST
ncbi:hypothetical protein ACE1CI_10615 [Aerosakkonemataceae cyanobacterium BLCC-F50]|uniref:Ice-binding protein C-terminal domain-containing protein n=1 Tax=Floridaenema flaviceps BLCC-F50 TaxID=3153642 RepID=A0ABV4XNS2_9CYAN